MREPFFGPNLKPLLMQTAAGLAAALTVKYLFGEWLYGVGYNFACTYLTGSCL